MDSIPSSAEAPEADAVEQALAVATDEDDADDNGFEIPLEVNPADAVEQRRRVGTQDEDDYR